MVSANAFLAPFERIVDFAVIDRDFDPDQGELTPKGTYRRKIIERNFADTIKLLYRRTTLSVGGAEVMVPNWLFQAIGITTQELEVDGRPAHFGQRRLPADDSKNRGNEIQIGSVVYVHAGEEPSISGSFSPLPCCGWATRTRRFRPTRPGASRPPTSPRSRDHMDPTVAPPGR